MIVKPGIPDECRWFDEARFGMFIHFGLYARPGRGEWLQYDENIPRERYAALARSFNPKRFCAEDWVGVAREAGARYITVTAKHHDGFCLFDSDLTDFKITRTPFKRDLIGELVEACHRAEMRIILYYSQPDWRHPNYVHQKGAFKDLPDPPASDQPDWPRFQAFLEGQVRELCTNYGRIDGIWFDGSHKSEQAWRGRRLYHMIKRLQPHAVVNDRARCGDFFTPERTLPEDLTGYLFEACQSVMAKSWGHHPDSALYSAPYLIHSLARMAVRGGNFLLNVGPNADGVIPPAQAARMRAVGQWLEQCGEAVYGTQAGPELPVTLCQAKRHAKVAPVASTVCGKRLYLIFQDWPETDQLAFDLPVRVKRAHWLTGGQKLEVKQAGKRISIQGLPLTPPDASVNVLALTLDAALPGPRGPVPDPRPAIRDLAGDGVVELLPCDAALTGRGVKGARLQRVSQPDGTVCIANWSAPQQAARWAIRADRPRRFDATVQIRDEAVGLGSVLALKVGKTVLEATVDELSATTGVRVVPLGHVELVHGVNRVALYPIELEWGYRFPSVVKLVLHPV